jgi:hypothetical protein
MPDIFKFAMGMLERNPNISNNPNASEFVNAIKSNDSVRGKQIAENLCNSYGMTTEQGVTQAKRYFGIK